MSDYTFSFIIENITLHLFIRNHILNVKIFLLANNKAIKAVKTHFKTDDQNALNSSSYVYIQQAVYSLIVLKTS